MVSHCDTPSKREVYVNELRKHVGVKIYGSCGFARPDPCRHSDEHSHDQCILDLFAAHKFYLAFENNRCDYYITEKYWKIYGPHLLFRVHTIPVVRGAQLEHYTREAPDNHSFIYADAFASPAHLARYLLYLDANRTAFDEYFAWKFRLVDKFRLQLERHDENAAVVRVDRQPRDDTAVFCEMCSKLHNETYLAGPNPIVYISEFFNPNRDCRNEREGDTLVEFFLKFIGFCTWHLNNKNTNKKKSIISLENEKNFLSQSFESISKKQTRIEKNACFICFVSLDLIRFSFSHHTLFL